MNNSEKIELMKANADKMNFQQNMCFQIQNWSIVVTVGIISVAWNLTLESDYNMKLLVISFHVMLVIFLLFLMKIERGWKKHFVIFRERANYLEKSIVENTPISNLKDEYYKYEIKKSGFDLTNDFRKSDLKINTIYIILIALAITSFIIRFFTCIH